MAKSSAKKINKSQLVRDYLAEHPRAKPRVIRPAIKAAFGVDISPQMISMIKTKTKSGGRRKVASAVRAKPARSITAEQLLAAKKLIDHVGGIEHARVLLDVLAKLG
ncbi:MAG: hypothetical protein SGJ20_06335 [Planctomycetota bacterium]|nr:hypothetical protein [Planctomycetota bacterium]